MCLLLLGVLSHRLSIRILNRLPGVFRCNSGAIPTTPFLQIVDGVRGSDNPLYCMPSRKKYGKGKGGGVTFGGLQTTQHRLIDSPRIGLTDASAGQEKKVVRVIVPALDTVDILLLRIARPDSISLLSTAVKYRGTFV